MNRKIHITSISGLVLIILLSFCSNRFDQKFYEEINVKVISNSIIVPIKINGKTYNFQLDSGAPTTISSNLFNSLNLDISETDSSADYYGNIKLVEESILPEITIGNTSFTSIKVGVHNIIQNFEPCGIQTDGLLGGNFFTNKILLIDIRKSKLIITNRISKIKLDQKNAIDIKLLYEQNIPELPIEFPSKNSGEYVWFDTGSNNYLYRLKKSIFHEMLKRKTLSKENILYELNDKHNGRGVFGGQKDSINYVVMFDSVKIGETFLLNCDATTFEANSDAKSKLGAPLLQKGEVVIDYINKKFYFTPYRQGSIDLIPKSGCYFFYENNKSYVDYVIPGSVADKHKIQVGYTLEKINSIVLDSLTLCERMNRKHHLSLRENNNVYVFKDKDREIVIKY